MTKNTLRKIFAPLALAAALAVPAYAQESASAPRPAATETLPALNGAGFFEALKSDKPVLVEFGAPWCPYCRLLKPNLEAVSEKKSGQMDFYQVNTDENPKLSQQYNVRGLPTMLIFYHGKVVSKAVGSYGARDLEKWVSDVAASVQKNASPKPAKP